MSKEFIQIKDPTNTYVVAEGQVKKGKYLLDTLRSVEYFEDGNKEVSYSPIKLFYRVGPWNYFQEDGMLSRTAIHNGKHEFLKNDLTFSDANNDVSSEKYVHLNKGKSYNYRSDGKVASERHFKRNGLLSKAFIYHKDGSIKYKWQKKYHVNKLLKESCSWENGKLKRKHEFIYKRKKCILERTILDGKETFRYEHKYRNNKKYKTICFRSGIETGTWLYFYKNDELEYRELYKDGKKVRRKNTFIENYIDSR